MRQVMVKVNSGTHDFTVPCLLLMFSSCIQSAIFLEFSCISQYIKYTIVAPFGLSQIVFELPADTG